MSTVRDGLRILTSREFWRDFRDYWSPEQVARRVTAWARDVQRGRDFREYECPRCGTFAPWTDGTVEAAGDERDEFWCQTCGAETPLTGCRAR